MVVHGTLVMKVEVSMSKKSVPRRNEASLRVWPVEKEMRVQLPVMQVWLS